jgi:ubiquinone/menaquinone biosynthesis C-methylase UbiE
MINRSKAEYFDSIAGDWDGWQDEDLSGRLEAGLDEFGVGPDETVIDIGCGTGNLTIALLGRLSPEGRVISVDISPAMVERARAKVDDPRVEFLVEDAADLPLKDESADRIICYSVWPHLDGPSAAVEEFRRILRPGGFLHVWHLSPREVINEIHSSAGEAVSGDILPPAADTAALIEKRGFRLVAVIEDGTKYIVSALKGGQRT